MLYHAGSGSDCGDAETMLCLERFDLIHAHGIRAGEEELHGVVSQCGCLGEAVGQGVMENKRTSRGFLDAAQGDGGLHQTDSI